MAGNRVISAVLTLKDKNFGSTAKKSATALTDFQRKAQHSTNTIRNFGKSATSSFKGVAAGAASITAAIGVTRALSGAFNMVKSSVSSAFDRIDTMEAFESTLTVLTGSTEKTKAALEATREAVTGTAYGLDVAAKSVQDFVTRGMDVEKATGVIESWGDAVAFYGDGSNEQLAGVTDALAKMYSTGKVSMDQMNRLYDAGIDGVGTYAKAVGRDAASVQKDLSKGKITAEDFIDVVGTAFQEGTNGVVKIAGAAKEAGSSWGSVFGNMRAAVTRGVEGIIVKIDEMLVSNGLPDMRSMVAEFGTQFEGVLNSAGDKIPMVTDFLVGMYQSAQPGLDWIANTGMPAVRDGIGFAVDKGKEMYDFFVTNWPLISPVVAGVAAAIGAFKLGIIAITAAKTTWAAVTSAVTIATGLLNGTLAVTPFGWIVLAIGAVVAAGVALYQNWEWVKEKALQLWQTVQDNPFLAIAAGPFGVLITAGVKLYQNFDKIKAAFDSFKNAISNFKLPGWVSTVGGALSGAASKVGNFISGSHATGLNRVPYDGYIAELHKDEMVVPATQSRNLRKQGLNIDNVDKGAQVNGQARTAQYNYQTTNVSNSDLPQLIQALMALVSALSNAPKGEVIIRIDGYNKSVTEIVNELIPELKLRIANM